MSNRVASRLVCYQSVQIPYVWPCVRPMIERGIARGSDYTIDEVLVGLCSRDLQLWTSESEKIEAALITAIQTDKKNTFCLLLLSGGENMEAWAKFLPRIEEWARDNGAEEMRIYGRRGWARVLDFDIEHTKMSRKL